MNVTDLSWTTAGWLAGWYDRLSIVYAFVMMFALMLAAGSLEVTHEARRRGAALGYAVGIAYLIYRYPFGDFDYPAEGLGAILRAFCAGNFTSSVVVIVAAGWRVVAWWRFRVQSALRRTSKAVAKIWTWL